MRLYIIAIGLLFLSCNGIPGQHFSDDAEDSVVTSFDTLVNNNIDSLRNTNMPVVFSTGATDTVISFSLEGISSEGSEIKVHYINDTITGAEWDIFCETGRITIKYDFLKNGDIRARERQYVYKVQLSHVKSSDDIALKDTINYLLDSNGIIKTAISKDFTDVYADFKANVSLVLKKRQR